MSTQLTTKKDESTMSYTPFGASDSIKLSVAIIKSLVAVQTRSGKTCDDRQAMKFMMLCQAQRLNPFAGDAFLVGYDKREKDGSYTPTFSLITAHCAFLKRAETSPDYEGMESGIILESEDGKITEREGDFKTESERVAGGWAKVYRKNRKPTYRRLSIAAMKPAYETPFWTGEKAAGQIVKCAEADALRATFPTLLGGLYVNGEVIEVQSTTTVVDSSRLVNVIADAPAREQEAEPESESRPTPAPARKTTLVESPLTPNDELAEVVTKAGHDFTIFQKWSFETGNLPDANSLSGFDDLKTEDCKRFLRAKTGLLRGLDEIKEAGR